MINKYSEMPDKKIIALGVATFRDAKIDVQTKEEIDSLRTRLAQAQYNKLKNIESFKELEICQKMMFEEKYKKTIRYKSQFK